MVITDDEFAGIFSVMYNQACGFGRVGNPEGQPDLEGLAGAQFVRQPVRWLSTLRDGCGASWVALSGLILEFDPRVSRALTNTLGITVDFHLGDPRVAARNRRTGKLRGDLRRGRVKCGDTPVIKTLPLA